MRLVFNELSLNDMPQDDRKITDILINIVKCFTEAMKSNLNFERNIATIIDLNSITFHNGFSIAKWRNSIDRDTSMTFKRICDRQILINELFDDIEIRCDRGIGKGFLLAYLNEDVALSLASHAYWTNFFIDAVLYDVSDDSERNIKLKNISNISNIAENHCHLSDMSRNEALECRTPRQLIDNVDNIFPYLFFHQNAVDQLMTKVEAQHIRALVIKLFEINEYFSTWNEGAFDPSKFRTKISPESTATLKKYEKEHTFLYKGREVIVSYHLRYTGNIPGRIYFYPDEISRKGIICSLTTKLPTVSEG